MKVLFISRAHPPAVGGIENQNAALVKWLPIVVECNCIVNHRGKIFLPLFIPYAVVDAISQAKKADLILLGDGVATIIGWFVKKIYPDKPFICIVHGLDISFRNKIYQNLWVKGFFHSVDHFIAVSRSTASLAVSHNIPQDNVTVIPNGIDYIDTSVARHLPRKELSILLARDLSEKRILLSIGRLVKRKGVAWFIRNVFPNLSDDYIYVVAGDGPERQIIDSLRSGSKNPDNIVCLGVVSDELKQTLFCQSDLFIQPNIPVYGDIEGFGITVLEAGMCGLPVVASDLEGLKDSVQHGENGWHVQPKSHAAFVDRINSIFDDPDMLQQARKKSYGHVRKNYSWDIVIRRYEKVIRSTMPGIK